MTKILKAEFYKTNAVPNILMYGVQLSLIRDMVSSGQAATFLIKELAEACPEMTTIPLTHKIPITFRSYGERINFSIKRRILLLSTFFQVLTMQIKLPVLNFSLKTCRK